MPTTETSQERWFLPVIGTLALLFLLAWGYLHPSLTSGEWGSYIFNRTRLLLIILGLASNMLRLMPAGLKAPINRFVLMSYSILWRYSGLRGLIILAMMTATVFTMLLTSSAKPQHSLREFL